MRINNYRGTVNDRPLDAMVVEPAVNNYNSLPVKKPNFMDNVLSNVNSHNVVPVGSVPLYDKG
jgi:hypothetical protein